LSRNQSSNSVDVVTIATAPIIDAWTKAGSALSAKSSMNRKRTSALMKSTIQSGGGITPSAPCVRSARAVSRSERWSNHFEYAACSDADLGSTACIVLNIARAHGFAMLPSLPSLIAGHSLCTTSRP
jgi:hypothetical protein